MLPLALLALIQAQLSYSQQSPQLLQLNNVYNFSGSSSLKSPFFSLPQSSSLAVSVALCADATSAPQFILSNDSTITQPGPDDIGSGSVFEIDLEDGYGVWNGTASDGAYLTVSNAGQTPFEIGVSDQGPLHSVSNSSDDLPLFGDSTSNQVLLFSQPIAPAPLLDTPTYPNYTLPPANLSYTNFGSNTPQNVSLFVLPATSSSLQTLPRTACAMRATTGDGVQNLNTTQSEGLWLKDDNGWRWQWMLTGLTSETNYTVYAITNGTYVSGPMNFVTKSDSFPCSIVHSLPYCPSINYAVPIDAPPDSAKDGAYDANSLPEDVVSPLLQILTNFTVSLTTFPCGRDQYSPLVSCNDCQVAYRKWLCSIWFPRCSEPTPDSGGAQTVEHLQKQVPVSALQGMPPTATPRSPGLSPFSSGYSMLLPCIETCTAVDRACPYFMGFKCPVPRFNAASSYGVGYIDGASDGEMGGGITGLAQDRYGNVWCNAG